MIELVQGLTERRTSNGTCVLRVHYSSDPERRTQEWKDRERRKYLTESAWQAEQEIVFGAGGGERLFAELLERWGHKILIDPETSGFEPSPTWHRFGGFDSGKANPTAALVGCIDEDGTIYILGEYYQPGLSPKQHVPFLRRLQGFMGNPIYSDPSIFFSHHVQNDGTFKAIAELYEEVGIENLERAPDNKELLGMERILAHWANLDQREPTLKIVCPTRLRDIAKPQYGVHNEGCPNLLWELRRARRAESTPNQLMNNNPTEKIVDKDSHLRDCLKYIVLARPEPAEQSPETAPEAIQRLIEAGDPTAAAIRHTRTRLEGERSDQDEHRYSRRLRRPGLHGCRPRMNWRLP
jgi:hypothetical protein